MVSAGRDLRESETSLDDMVRFCLKETKMKVKGRTEGGRVGGREGGRMFIMKTSALKPFTTLYPIESIKHSFPEEALPIHLAHQAPFLLI